MPTRLRLPSWLPALLLGLAAFLAYSNTFSVPFVFDDQFAIVENPTIRHLGDLRAVLSPPPYAAGAAGRPLVNLSLALNYAAGGLNPRGYHAVNLALHILCALALFGILRRTLGGARCPPRAEPPTENGPELGPRPKTWKAAAPQVAWGAERCERFGLGASFCAALVWAVHPLLTESVTCVIQRDEVLSGLFYLLSLYLFIRFTEHRRPGWAVAAVIACWLGIAAKEIVVSLPLIALLYDRTFVSHSFSVAWRRHRRVYAGLAASWILLAALMLGSHQRGGTVGFGLGVSSWDYLLTSCRAIGLYLKLSLWPHPLVIDYGTDLVTSAGAVTPQALLLILLAGASLASLRRPSPAGFLGLFFFAILAPSSSIVPLVSQPIAEHRMYLPLAAVATLAVVGLAAFAGRRSLLLWPALAALLAAATFARNAEYHSEPDLIAGELQANPRNDRAYLNRGSFEARSGQDAAAMADFRRALQLRPESADTEYDLAAVLEHSGANGEAIYHYQAAVRIKPDYPAAQYFLGLALARAGRMEEAESALAAALRLQPGSAAVRSNLAVVHRNLGIIRATSGNFLDAISEFQAALRLDPNDELSQADLARARAILGR